MKLLKYNVFRRLVLIGALSSLLFALAFSNSAVIKKIDGAYSRIISQEIDRKKAVYELQLHCQLIEAKLIDMLFALDQDDLAGLKKQVYGDFQVMDKKIAALLKMAATDDIRKQFLSVNDTLLVYRRVCSTFMVLLDEKKTSEASLLLRFNVHRTYTSAAASLAAIPQELDRDLKKQSEYMSNANVNMAGAIRNAGTLPALFWLCGALILFVTYLGVPSRWAKR